MGMGPIDSYHSIYVSMCGRDFPSYASGSIHERDCPDCQRLSRQVKEADAALPRSRRESTKVNPTTNPELIDDAFLIEVLRRMDDDCFDCCDRSELAATIIDLAVEKGIVVRTSQRQ